MGVRVAENLGRMKEVVGDGDMAVAELMIAADDDIDAMNVSLTERCYDVLRREAPVAADLRLVVSVLRVLGELERIGDLALRVAKRAPEHHLIAASPLIHATLRAMTEIVIDRYQRALDAWATLELDLATEVALAPSELDTFNDELMVEVLGLDGPTATRTAICAFAVGRSVERIGDHAAIMGARLRYLITGDPAHLAAEVR